MLNRTDSQSVPGGDTMQMIQTKAGLEKLGVEVCIGSEVQPETLSQFDLVHIFNWQQVGGIRANWELSNIRIPVVLSTIFWFHSGHWFDEAVKKKRLWRTSSRLLGHGKARKIYESWQSLKFSRGSEGKVLRQNLQEVDLLLPNSALEIDHLEGILGLRGALKPKCIVVPNGVVYHDAVLPTTGSKLDEALANKQFVLQAARIQSAKNQLSLLQALIDVPVMIVFAGQPSPYELEYVETCRILAEKRGNVIFTGQLTSDELAGLYNAATVHALPSFRETPGLASLEAAAAGCRVVTTSVGSAREYFGTYAWYCDPGSVKSIRKAVLQALDSPVPRGLREHVLKHYTWEEAAKTTLAGYEMVLRRHSNA